jgi:hypothetical protein
MRTHISLRNSILVLLSTFSLAILSTPLPAQELEPRSLTNVPVGMNFLFLGYGYAKGNVLLDPAIPIEDLDSRLHSFVGAYVRALDLFGLSGKLDVIVPFAAGDWSGLLQGQAASTSRTGFGDPRFRLSVNFYGAPALRASEFRSYSQKWTAGASLQVIAPLGLYYPDELINLGSNRWTIRSQLGAANSFGRWTIEAYTGIWFFTRNPDFYGGNLLEQRPLWTAKIHLVRSLSKGIWASADLGYGRGGRSVVQGVARDTRISTFRFGLTLSVPLAPQHALKLYVVSGKRVEQGADFDGIGIGYQYYWGSK